MRNIGLSRTVKEPRWAFDCGTRSSPRNFNRRESIDLLDKFLLSLKGKRFFSCRPLDCESFNSNFSVAEQYFL